MKNRYDIVIFDLDGTLLDTIDDLGAAVNHAMAEGGWPLHSMQEYRGMVGHGVRNLVTRALPEALQGDDSTIDAALKSFKEYYTSHIAVNTHPYEGVVELLHDLVSAGCKVAVASNKFQSGTEALVSRFFHDVDFIAVLGNSEGAPLKPDAAIVRHVIEGSGIPDATAVMVGDSGTDIRTAANGGIPSVGVTWGFRSLSDLEASGATMIARDVRNLRSFLLCAEGE